MTDEANNQPTPAPNDQPWQDLCALDDLPTKGGLYVEHGSRALAVFRVDGGVRVIDDHCPHAGQSLSSGALEREVIDPPNVCVICPWHGWAFRIDDGACPDNEQYRVAVHEAKVVDGRVLARVSDPR